MGLDLRLLPFDADFFSRTILSCERRRDLFTEILKVDKKIGRDVPDSFKTFTGRNPDTGDTCYGTAVRTPYGENMKYILASDLFKFAQHKDVMNNWLNQAIWAYLGCLPPDTKIALYWH